MKINAIFDVDGVVADFVSGIIREAKKRNKGYEFPDTPNDVTCWDICEAFYPLFKEVQVDMNFWLNLPVLNKTNLTPRYYLTSRPFVPSGVTYKWLQNTGVPLADVITVRSPLEKLDILQELQPDIFLDDHIETVERAREVGINAYLFSSPYQRGHDIKSDTPIISNIDEVKSILGGKQIC